MMQIFSLFVRLGFIGIMFFKKYNVQWASRQNQQISTLMDILVLQSSFYKIHVVHTLHFIFSLICI